MEERLKVAKVVERFNVSRNQLLHWEKQELLGNIQRELNPDSGMEDRVYSKEQLKRVVLIRELLKNDIKYTESLRFLVEYFETEHITLVDKLRDEKEIKEL